MPKMCGIAKHPLRNGVLVTDPNYWKFIRKLRIDFREDDEVCLVCKNSMEHMYWYKKKRVKLLRDSRAGRVSSLSSYSTDSIDDLVLKTPKHQKTIRSDNDSSQSISGLSSYAKSTPTNSQSLNDFREKSQQSKSSKNATNILQESRRQSINGNYATPPGKGTTAVTMSQSASKENSLQSSSKKSATNKPKESHRQSLNDSCEKSASNGTVTVTLSLGASRDNSLQSRSNTSATNMPQETRRQSLNDSLEKSRSKRSEADISRQSTSSTVSEQSSAVTVIRKKVIFSNKDAVIPNQQQTTSKVISGLQNQDRNTVLSPTIYDIDPTETNYFTNSLNLRLSQEPTTSSAASKAKGTVNETNPVLTNVTPRSRGIREFFTPLQVNGDSANNKHGTAGPSDGETASKRTEQASTSKQKRPLNDKADGSKDTSNSDDEDQIRSLNYYNPDVRFPQYQPIPKRRRFQHKNDTVMDIYIQGLTGG